MHKTFLLIIFSLTICVSSFSQLKLGLKAGLNFSTISNVSYSSGFNRTTFFNAGIMARHDFSKKFYFSPQLLFSQKGFSELLIPSGTTRLYLNYISLPLYCSYKLTKRISIQVAPEISYLTSAKYKTPNSTSDATNSYNQIELSLSGGLNIKLGKKFFAELTYNHGLTNVIRSFGTSFPATGRNNLLQINLGYYFK